MRDRRTTPEASAASLPAALSSGQHDGHAEDHGGYAEDHCALRWPLQTAGVWLPALAVAVVIASIAVQESVFMWLAQALLVVASITWVAGSGTWLLYLWPTGVRVDAQGVRIGGVRWQERHPGQTRARKAIVPRQCSQVFSCPWSGVLSIGVTTDRDAIKIMKRYAYRGRKVTPLGNLAVPYMNAALVIWVDQDQSSAPKIRPASGIGWYSSPEPGYHQPLWIVPTRHPSRLSEALTMWPQASAKVQDPSELFRSDPPIAAWLSS